MLGLVMEVFAECDVANDTIAIITTKNIPSDAISDPTSLALYFSFFLLGFVLACLGKSSSSLLDRLRGL